MNDKQILDRLSSINLSLRQKKDLIDIIKDIAGNNNSDDNDSNDNNKLYIYVNTIENKILINNVEYEVSEGINNGYDDAALIIKNETLYNYINNYFDKNYYANATLVYKTGDDEITHLKVKLPLSHIIYENADSFDIVYNHVNGYYAYLRIIK